MEFAAVPEKFTRDGNTDHQGIVRAIASTRLFNYGTAGFRALAIELPFLIYRMGFLAGIRSKLLGKGVGLMITASHNPEEDNGVKIIDPMGEMLEMKWEKLATDLVNCSDGEYEKMRSQLWKTYVAESHSSGEVLCGYDTRPSSVHLSEAARCGIESAHCKFHLHGLLTTPQLHYIVRCFNDKTYGVPSEEGYYQKYSQAFNELLEVMNSSEQHSEPLVVDCANGVGALKLKNLLSRLKPGVINWSLLNTNGVLNKECGADYVKLEARFPKGFSSVSKNNRCASLDGDADRLLYFFQNDEGNFVLLDGDKIATLIAKFFEEHLHASGLSEQFSIAVVQTAYANGGSTRYIKETLVHFMFIAPFDSSHKVNTAMVPTGVKHLHHEALKYDVGIYFEANGHGTVVFSDRLTLHSLLAPFRGNNEEKIELKRLRLLVNLINDVVGDAMSDLLTVEALLMHYKWSVVDWAAKLYSDLPSCQLKVKVRDRSLFKTTVDETRLTSPSSLQLDIDKAVSKYHSARSFVRYS
ncbi:unnamed protein product [Enterobius vermicularis]|uniref:Phosphoacetylglucosamine mutase n=1 Tax=Enterobius vermicularis TaxID=51028 RepID=A0A0N4UWS0_ENTVE|nr:unnamed protein product [Enterobius vermicularis]